MLSYQLRLSLNTAKNIRRRYCEENQFLAKLAGGFRRRKIDEDDLELIEILKHEKPSISFSEISHILQKNGGVQDISFSAVGIKSDQRRSITLWSEIFS